MRLEKFVTIALLSTTLLSAQSLTAVPSEIDRNKTGSFSVRLDTPSDRAPLALQWDLLVPPVIAIRTEDITIGEAAHGAGKSLTCALRNPKKTSRRVRYTCILAGGRKPLSDGPVAEVHYRAQWDLRDAPAHVGIENVLGVSGKLERIPMADADVTIHIR